MPLPDLPQAEKPIPGLVDGLQHRENAVHAAVLNALPSGIALLDPHGAITSVNAAWRAFGDANGLRAADHAVGTNYLEVCERTTGADRPMALQVALAIRDVLAGTRENFTLEYPCHAPGAPRWFSVAVSPLPGRPPMGAVVMHTDITRRRQAADALAELSRQTEQRERLLGKTLSSISDLAYAFDRGGRILFANEPALRLWGVTLEYLTGKTVVDLGYPDDLARRIQRQIEHVFATGENVKDETPYVSPAGEGGYYEYIFSPVIGADGSVEFGVGSSREVTARKKSEQALQASVAEFRTLAAAMPQIVWTSDGQGRITYLNQHWVDYTGHPAWAMVGKSWNDVLREQDVGSPAMPWPQAAAGQGFTTEVRLRRSDGQVRWWLMRGVPLFDAEGRLLKWLGTCTDIDELKLAEARVSQANAELQRQRTELRTLFDLVPAMIWSKDTRNNFMRVNERAASSVGLTVAEVEGRSAHEIYPAEADAFFARDQAIIRSNRPILGTIEVARDAAGGERWAQKDEVPYHDEHGNVIGVLVMSHDITDRKRDQDALRELNADLEERVRRRTAELALARDDAERANQAKSTFLATMSHEIRTPMSGLLGLLEMLELTDLDADQRDTLGVARESGKALQRLIDGILDFSRIEANSLELDVRPSSMRAVVDHASRLHGQVAAAKKLALVTCVAPEISACLLFDPLRLGQILNNLVGNAIKFSEQGEVRVEVELVSRGAASEVLRVSVRDTGIGIAPDQVGRLFKPFAQADAQTSTRYGGTGLGLFISRRLAELMGGELRLDSSLGRGTLLTLKVAFATCDEAPGSRPVDVPPDTLEPVAPRAAARDVPAVTGNGRRLLVVDDHPVNRQVLLRQAAALGYAAEAAEGGVEALHALESARFDAMLTDCNMPGMSGFELVRRIRAAEAARGAPRMPVIGCTANAFPSAAADCLDAGMDDVVTKPVDLAKLSETLGRWLREPGAPDVAVPDSTQGDMSVRLPPNQGLLDLAMVAAISRGDLAAQRRVLDDFRRTNEADAAAIREALGDGAFDRLVHHAHRLRGACSMLGSTLLADVSAAIQAAASQQDGEQVSRLVGELDVEMLRLNRYLAILATRSA